MMKPNLVNMKWWIWFGGICSGEFNFGEYEVVNPELVNMKWIIEGVISCRRREFSVIINTEESFLARVCRTLRTTVQLEQHLNCEFLTTNREWKTKWGLADTEFKETGTPGNPGENPDEEYSFGGVCGLVIRGTRPKWSCGENYKFDVCNGELKQLVKNRWWYIFWWMINIIGESKKIHQLSCWIKQNSPFFSMIHQFWTYFTNL